MTMITDTYLIANRITSEMVATYTALYHLEDMINSSCDCEVTLHRLVTRLTSHFKSVYNWYVKQNWSTKCEYMASAYFILRMIKKCEAYGRFIAIDDNKEKFDLLWEQVK